MKKPKKIKAKKPQQVKQVKTVAVATPNVPDFSQLSLADRRDLVASLDPKSLALHSSYGLLVALSHQYFPSDENLRNERLNVAKKVVTDGLAYIEKMPFKYPDKEPKVLTALKKSFKQCGSFIIAGPNGNVPFSTFLENFCHDALGKPWAIYPSLNSFNNHHNASFMNSWNVNNPEPIIYYQYQELEAKAMYYHQMVKKADGVGIFERLPMTRAIYEGDRIDHTDNKVVISRPVHDPSTRPPEIIGFATIWKLVDGYEDYEYSDVIRLAKLRFNTIKDIPIIIEDKKGTRKAFISQRDKAVDLAQRKLYTQFWRFVNSIPIMANESQEKMMRKTALIGAFTSKLNSAIQGYAVTLGFNVNVKWGVNYKDKCPITPQTVAYYLEQKQRNEGEV